MVQTLVLIVLCTFLFWFVQMVVVVTALMLDVHMGFVGDCLGLLQSLNCLNNPIIYAWKNRELRKEFLSLLGKQQPVTNQAAMQLRQAWGSRDSRSNSALPRQQTGPA